MQWWFLGYFLLAAKLTFGRVAQTNIIDAFEKVSPKKVSKLWGKYAGFANLFNIFLLISVFVWYVWLFNRNIYFRNVWVGYLFVYGLENFWANIWRFGPKIKFFEGIFSVCLVFFCTCYSLVAFFQCLKTLLKNCRLMSCLDNDAAEV